MKLTCDTSIADPEYVFYFFRSDHGRHELLKNASTVGTPGIATPLTSLRRISIPLPPLPTQRAIAHILATLDDKIALNRRKKAIQRDDILFSEIRPGNKRYAYVDFDSARYVVSTKFMILRG